MIHERSLEAQLRCDNKLSAQVLLTYVVLLKRASEPRASTYLSPTATAGQFLLAITLLLPRLSYGWS
jgi:hypothetical protein